MQSVRSPYRRAEWYLAQRFAPGIDSVLTILDDKAHAKRRRQMIPAFQLQGSESIIDRHICNLVDLIRQKYVLNESRPMDLAEKCQFLTIDVITELATGKSFGDLALDEDKFEFLRWTANVIDIMIMAFCVPFVASLIQTRWIGSLLAFNGMETKGYVYFVLNLFSISRVARLKI